MKALEIAKVGIRRTVRDRLGLFFILLMPLILIVVLGLTYGGMSTGRVGLVDGDHGTFATDLVSSMRTSEIQLELRRYDTPAALRDAVARGFVEVGLAIPAGYSAAIERGEAPSVEMVAQPTTLAGAVRSVVDAAIAQQVALVGAARFAAEDRGLPMAQALALTRAARAMAPGVAVVVEPVVDQGDGPSGFTLGAQSQVILFMFLTSMTAATHVIITRRLGIARRMYATPTGSGTIVAGETLGRFAFALFQGGFIVSASALLFGVAWGDPVATAAVLVAFALVATGAAMVVGTLASNAEQASALGVGIAMLLALLGGAMVPSEVFPEVMRTLAWATPHAWAIDAFRAMRTGTIGIADILPQLGVLLAFAAVLLGLSSWRFRRLIERGGGVGAG
jgi:ABC-2 type transport system permease protein